MQDGLYSVSFQTPSAAGAGVIVKNGNSVAGGDSAFAWFGEMSDDGATLAGSLQVVKHGTSMVSVFGHLTDFVLTYTGSFDGGSATLTATTSSAPGVRMTINLRPLKV